MNKCKVDDELGRCHLPMEMMGVFGMVVFLVNKLMPWSALQADHSRSLGRGECCAHARQKRRSAFREQYVCILWKCEIQGQISTGCDCRFLCQKIEGKGIWVHTWK